MKAFFVLLFKEVKRNIGSFLIIALTVFLAVAVASGMLCYAINAKTDAENYFDSGKMWDIKITSTLGFTREDVLAVGSAQGVEKASPVIAADTNCSVNGMGNYGTKICGIDLDTVAVNPDNTVAAPRLIRGSYPSNANSCVVVVSPALNSDIKVGDVVSLNNNMGDCTQTEFTVTGLVYSPEYSSYLKDSNKVNDGGTQIVMFVSTDAFAPEAAYTEINVLLKGSTQLQSFSRDYTVFVNTALGEINVVANKREQIRGENLGDEYLANIDKLQKQYDYIKNEGEKEVKELTEIIGGIKKKTDDTDKILADREKALADKKALLNILVGTSQYSEKLEEYNAEFSQYQSDKESNEMTKATALRLEEDIKAIEKATAQKLETAEKNLEQAINGTKADYMQKWHLSTREANAGFSSIAHNQSKISALFTMIAILIIIAEMGVIFAVVSFTINRCKKEIGIMKSSGCSDADIKKKYFSVLVTADVIGSVIGICSASAFIPSKIQAVIGLIYNITVVSAPPIYISFIIAIFILAVILFAMIFLLNRALKCPLTELIYTKNNEQKVKLPVLSDKIPSVLRVLLRSVIRYKYAFCTAAICIAFISAFVISAFNIVNKPALIYKNQYTNLQKYDITAELKPYTDYTQNVALRDYLADKNCLPVLKTELVLSCEEQEDYITAIVPIKTDNFDEFWALKKGLFNKKIKLTKEKIVITKGFADKHGVSAGDTIELTEGKTVLQLTVTDVCKNYIGDYIYIHPEKYAELVSASPVADTLLINNPKSASSSSDAVALYDTGIVYSVNLQANGGIKEAASLGGGILISTLIIGTLLLYYIMNMLYSSRTEQIRTLKFSGFGVLSIITYFSIETVAVWLAGTVLGFIGTYLINFPLALINLEGINTAPYISASALLQTLPISLLITVLINAVILSVKYIKK